MTAAVAPGLRLTAAGGWQVAGHSAHEGVTKRRARSGCRVLAVAVGCWLLAVGGWLREQEDVGEETKAPVVGGEYQE